jgi:hypothetical protein
MHLPARGRAWRIAGTGLLTLALTVGLATWPWNRADLPEAEAQEETTATDGVAESEAEALAEAVASGMPVEVLSLRSEMRDVFAQPDGSFIASEYQSPVRTMVGGAWAEIDPTLEVADNGRIVPATVTVSMAFSSGGDEPLVSVAKNGHVMTMDWPGELPAPSLDGDTAVYAEVLPGVDLRVTALVDGFTHTLVVKSAEAAANPELASIAWPVTLDGAAIEATAEGGVAVVDSGTFDTWIGAHAPVMWDSSGVAEAAAVFPYVSAMDLTDPAVALEAAAEFGRYADVGISSTGSTIVLNPDQGLLTGANTVYPVYIDPVYKDETRSTWAMVDSAYPNESYWKWTGSQGVGGIDGHKKRVFYSVPTSAYKGKVVQSAEFAVTVSYNWYSDNHATGYDIYLDKVSSFSSGTTWNNKPSYSNIAKADAPAATGGTCSSPTEGATSAMEWGITSTVQAAANAGTSSLSFQVRNYSETEEVRWIRVCNNAQLRVKYNTPPDQPLMANMWTKPGGTCQWTLDVGVSYTNELPILYTRAFDDDNGANNEWGPDTGAVSEEIKVQWQLTNSSDAVIATHTSGWDEAGSLFQWNLKTAGLSIASGTEVRWEARAYDGASYSPWSSAGSPSRCRFVYDTTAPNPPQVTSTDFPEIIPATDTTEAVETVVPMVGKSGSLTFDTDSANVVSYTYDFSKDSVGPQTVVPSEVSGPATIKYLPMLPGSETVTVSALNAAGSKAEYTYSFIVSAADPVGVWTLGDAAGSPSAADVNGTNPGTPGAGVTFGAAGPGTATAAVFNGTANAYIETKKYAVAPTGRSVSIAAWARVDNLAKDGTVASIDGGLGEAGMVLGYRSTSATTGQWVLLMPDMAMGAFTSWEVLGGQVTTSNQDEWVHLVGVWNEATGDMTLYINGAAAASAERETTWWGDGTVQIGRAGSGGTWSDPFTGAIADVRVFNRVVPPGEAEYLGWQLATRQGLWQLNDVAADGVSSPEYGEGLPLVLAGGAVLYKPTDEDLLIDPTATAMVGAGHLQLNGTSSYATVASPVVDTARSFTLSARVRLSTGAPTASMTVLSIPGTNNSAVEVAYEPACDGGGACWQLRLRESDEAGAVTTVVEGGLAPTAVSQGQELTVVFDGTTGQARLYVDGYASERLTNPFLEGWAATGNLQLGRGYTDGTYGDYFAGAIDDVRAYTGVLHPSVIARLSLVTADDRPNI